MDKPPDRAEIEVRGQKFVVKPLTIEEEGQAIALRDKLARVPWGDLVASKSASDTGWALIFEAAGVLEYAIVKAPEDFPGPSKCTDPDFIWDIYQAYLEKLVRPFRAEPVERAEKESGKPAREGLPATVVQE